MRSEGGGGAGSRAALVKRSPQLPAREASEAAADPAPGEAALTSRGSHSIAASGFRPRVGNSRPSPSPPLPTPSPPPPPPRTLMGLPMAALAGRSLARSDARREQLESGNRRGLGRRAELEPGPGGDEREEPPRWAPRSPGPGQSASLRYKWELGTLRARPVPYPYSQVFLTASLKTSVWPWPQTATAQAQRSLTSA